MENNRNPSMMDQKIMILSELNQAKELLIKHYLQMDLSSSTSTTSNFLLHKILSCLENSISMISVIISMISVIDVEAANNQAQATGLTELSRSINGSLSGSDVCHSDPVRNPSRKRKPQPKRTEQAVLVCKQKGLQKSLDDGFNWRKYGQKDILHSKHPRAYYRCKRYAVEGCQAMKQVQQSNEDPWIFKVTYLGKHTCIQAAHLGPVLQQIEEEEELAKTQETIISTVETVDFGTNQVVPKEPSFSLPSIIPLTIPCVEQASGNNSSMTRDNNFISSPFTGPYISLTASESNSVALYNGLNNSGGDQFTSAANSTLDFADDFVDMFDDCTSSPAFGMYSPLDNYARGNVLGKGESWYDGRPDFPNGLESPHSSYCVVICL